MRKLILCLLLCIATISAKAQTPRWVNNPPRPMRGNNTYTFIVTETEAYNLDIGRKKCLQLLSLDMGLINTVTINYRSEERIYSAQKRTDNNFDETVDEQLFEVITMDGKPIKLTARRVDEYFDRGRGTMATLYQVGLTPNPQFDEFTKTDFYGFEAGWRSAVVPGWGQFHKGDYKKGAMMLGGTLALAGSVVLTEATRADYEQKYGLTHDVSARKEYLNRHNHWQLARNICVGALAGFYIYNIVDAFNAPGARYVVVRLADNDGRTYNFAPSVSPEGYPMAMATITF